VPGLAGKPMRRVRLVSLLVSISAMALFSAGCTGGGSGRHAGAGNGPPSTVTGSTAGAARVTITGLPATTKVTGSDTGAAAAPGKDIAFLSDVYRLGPSGPLSAPATVSIPLTRAAAPGTVVVVATRETPDQAWSYLPGKLTAGGDAVVFTTRHFSLFGILGYDLGQMVSAFKNDFIDGLDSDATAELGKSPGCANEAEARQDGYKISSDSGDTVFWCFGIEGGHRVLKVTDHRRYPLEVVHPNMSISSNSFDRLQLSALSRLVSGQHAIIEPGGTATFNADLSPGGDEGISTELDGVGQSFYALETAVRTLVSILTRFGTGSGVDALEKFDSSSPSPAAWTRSANPAAPSSAGASIRSRSWTHSASRAYCSPRSWPSARSSPSSTANGTHSSTSSTDTTTTTSTSATPRYRRCCWACHGRRTSRGSARSPRHTSSTAATRPAPSPSPGTAGVARPPTGTAPPYGRPASSQKGRSSQHCSAPTTSAHAKENGSTSTSRPGSRNTDSTLTPPPTTRRSISCAPADHQFADAL
jgi:hypothetical protein